MTAQRPTDREASRAKNLGYAAAAAQSGCWSLIIVFVALFAGLWLDAQFQVRGPFTIGLLLLSIPISLFVMVRIALGAIKMIQTQQNEQRQKESHTEEG